MMNFEKGNAVLSWCCALLLFCSASVLAQGYDIAPAPPWVVSVAAPKDDWVEKAPGTNGEAYLLVDRQWSMVAGRQQYYNHFATKARSTSGVEEVSGIAIDFDPLYESLTLHGVTVWRDGVAQDRLGRSRIDLIQREKELEYQLYDGTRTLNVILEDVRPGDTVEYSYTLEGGNPIFAGHFSETLNTRWTVPVGRLHYRMLWPSQKPLHIRNHETGVKPIKRVLGRETEYIWLSDQVAALQSDGDTPSWYDPFPKITLSDMADWQEVVDWALPLYVETPVTEAEQELIGAIDRPQSSQEDKLLESLDFVQEQIRYLGLEMGESSHQPSLPAEVLERRYGDCKDKTRLLVSLLRGLGIEAYPALVNTHSGVYLKDALPSQLEFDHVIVLARLNGRNYWLDPTRTHQRGDLETLYQPDYDYALVVAERDGGLVKMSDDIEVVHGKRVEEVFDISGGVEQPVSYRLLTQVDHYYADSFRESLAETNLQALQQSYLNYAAGYYPSIEVAGDIEVTEAEEKNVVAIVEHYRIPGAWKPQAGSSYMVMNFEPSLIDDHISAVDSPKRTAPYAVTHPVRYRHTTRVKVPLGSEFENEYYEIDDAAFRFTKSVEFDGSELVIDYLYESLRDHVTPADIAQHAKHLRDVYNLSSYQVRMLDPALGFGDYRFEAGDVNWMLVNVSLLTLVIAGFLSYRFIYFPDPPAQKPAADIDPKLVGLSGWLILPAISISLFPFGLIWGARELLYLFSAAQWSVMAEDASVGLLAWVISEVVLNVVMLVLSLFMIVMFVTRRSGFPKLFIGFYCFVLVFTGGDLLILHFMGLHGVEVEVTDVQEFLRLLVYAVIWGSYFVRSRRVKATFTRSRKGKEPQWQGQLVSES
ncbi:MAG: DUF3857 domain-containing protein [Candidatus Thiodiazotropha sp.]